MKIKKELYLSLMALCLATNVNTDQNLYTIGTQIESEADEKATDEDTENKVYMDQFVSGHSKALSEYARSINLVDNFTAGISNDLLTDFQNSEDVLYDSYLTTYAKYFNFDADKVIAFARNLTKNYTIPFKDINNCDNYNDKDIETNCMIFCHQILRDDLYASLEDLGYSKEDFLKNNEITTINDDLTLKDSNLTFYQFFGKVCDMIDIDKTYALPICLHETSHLNSRLLRVQNNVGGLRNEDGEHFTYASPEAGIIAFCRNLKRYDKMNINNITELSGMYVHGDINKPDHKWAKSVASLHEVISNDQDEYFAIQNNNKVYQKSQF